MLRVGPSPSPLAERWPPRPARSIASYVARNGAGHPNFLFKPGRGMRRRLFFEGARAKPLDVSFDLSFLSLLP